MNNESQTYDEHAELTRYIWRSYRRLMTADEILADSAFSAEIKFRADSRLSECEPNPRLLHLQQARKRYENNAFVQEALRHGYVRFQAMVRDRIVEEMPEAFVVNRCPACQRIVATPLAAQCLWCGHNWHRSK